MRSGIIAESSASRKQRIQPQSVTKMISGMEAAPSVVTITGAMPVTRIVPARPDDEGAPPIRLSSQTTTSYASSSEADFRLPASQAFRGHRSSSSLSRGLEQTDS